MDFKVFENYECDGQISLFDTDIPEGRNMAFKDVMHKPVNCKYCGKEFVPTSCKNVFCCKECHQKWKNDVARKKKKKKPKEKKKSNHELIVDVDKEAKANGMSYGQWVALMYQQSNRKG